MEGVKGSVERSPTLVAVAAPSALSQRAGPAGTLRASSTAPTLPGQPRLRAGQRREAAKYGGGL